MLLKNILGNLENLEVEEANQAELAKEKSRAMAENRKRGMIQQASQRVRKGRIVEQIELLFNNHSLSLLHLRPKSQLGPQIQVQHPALLSTSQNIACTTRRLSQKGNQL